MNFGFWRRVRHPLYPHLPADQARKAPKVTAALAGTFEELRSAAAAGCQVKKLLFVLVRPERPFLTPPERDLLWETFQVPSYLLLRGETGGTLAYECEAQEGLHIRRRTLPLEGAVLLDSPCECGRPGNRIVWPISSGDTAGVRTAFPLGTWPRVPPPNGCLTGHTLAAKARSAATQGSAAGV
jgi:hypothetical protein